jgi:ribonuclease HII
MNDLYFENKEERVCRSESFDKGNIAGIDEVAVESIVGDMIGSVVVLPNNHGIKELPVDSKRLNSEEIEELYHKIKEKAVFISVYHASPEAIDKKGIYNSQKRIWQRLAKRARDTFPNIPLFIDGREEIEGFDKQESIIGGDELIDSISAAAIIAKHVSNQQFNRMHEEYPMYAFNTNRGYPKRSLIEAMSKHGLTPYHRVKLSEKALAKGIPTESLTLSNEQIEVLLHRGMELLQKDERVTSSWGKEFLTKKFNQVFAGMRNLNEKEIFYVNKTVKEMEKKWERLKSYSA